MTAQFVTAPAGAAIAVDVTGAGPAPMLLHRAGKGHIPVWVACFQAMRRWPPIHPHQLRCPALLLVGSRNPNPLQWVQANRPALEAAGVQVEIVQGLDHPAEFTQIDRVFPAVSAFFRQHLARG